MHNFISPLLPPLHASLQINPDLLLRGRGVRVVFFDVDGVLTDGGLYFSEYPPTDTRMAGETLKRFNTLDGYGLVLLQQAGITPAIITGRDSVPLRARLQALGISHACYGIRDKRAAAESILATLDLNWNQAAAMGDDWPDIAIMRHSALACAPANAHIEVKNNAHYTTHAEGGHGAVRELCDLLLMANGHYATFLQDNAG